MKLKLFFFKTWFGLINLLAGLTGHQKLIRMKILAGSVILGMILLPSCHSRKKATCYLMALPDPPEKEILSQGAQTPLVPDGTTNPLMEKTDPGR